jgi:hypothetical protein
MVECFGEGSPFTNKEMAAMVENEREAWELS